MTILSLPILYLSALMLHDGKGHAMLKPEWSIERTEVFYPLLISEVLIHPSGEAYIVSFDNATVLHFDNKGKELANIGRKGEGPGEFIYPSEISLHGDVIYVKDGSDSSYTLFKPNGEYIDTLQPPSHHIDAIRVKNGWIFGDWVMEGKTAALFWADPKFNNVKEIMRLPAGSIGGVWTDKAGITNYAMIKNRPFLFYYEKDNKVLVSHTEAFQFSVVDVLKKEVVDTIKLTSKAIEFDKEWGASKVKRMKLKRARMGIHGKIKGIFPEYFPVVREIKQDLEGLLHIDKWMGNPEINHNFMVVNSQGKEVKPKYGWSVVNRLVAVSGGYAYLTTFDAQVEEAGLAKVKLDILDGFLDHNTLIYKGSGGRTMIFN